MNYTSILLNGDWEMYYSEDKYTSIEAPVFCGDVICDAIPAYWENMTDKFADTSFFNALRINPKYTDLRYPMLGWCPDMSLPNICGNFFYRRSFICEDIGFDAVLHFAGVQSAVSAWLNGEYISTHEGYSTSFDMEIPKNLIKRGENELILSVSNHRLDGFDGNPVTGITSRAACECSGGVWGDVELRAYKCTLRDARVLISEDCNTASVIIESTAPVELDWFVLDGENIVKSGHASDDFSFCCDNMKRWTPDTPHLYTLRLQCGDTGIEKSFGVRRLTVDGFKLRLNGESYYLRGVCEHCYYPLTVNPCNDISFYRDIISKMKELGFNFIRFHTHVPREEYMQAADELGMLMEIESPSNTTFREWCDIVRACSAHTSTVIYCCGNELQLYDKFIEHLKKCADEVHAKTDSLFSPMSALRGLEYSFEPELIHELCEEPFRHNPRRFAVTREFTDVYNSYTLSQNSYESLTCDPAKVDSWSEVYGRPRISHEICINGTYTDLSLKNRYKGTRIGETAMFSSIEEHLRKKGLLHRAPIYFKNSCEWQRRIRKHCFEETRRSDTVAGYDFLGPIDTHWHTFGYDVGMMNEFYELKPGESIQNVRRYNSDTVLLTDLGRRVNFSSGEKLHTAILTSCYGVNEVKNGQLSICLTVSGVPILQQKICIDRIEGGKISELFCLEAKLPEVKASCQMKLFASLEADSIYAENEWELYLFPTVNVTVPSSITVLNGTTEENLIALMEKGERVVIFGTEPFCSNETSFQISIAGRTNGNLATLITPHSIFEEFAHDGFCSWQFDRMLTDGRAVVLEGADIPYEPIIEVASSHKNAVKQSTLFEFAMENGKFLVCSFNMQDDDVAAKWLKSRIFDYVCSDSFKPHQKISRAELHAMINCDIQKNVGNANVAQNPNDETTKKKK